MQKYRNHLILLTITLLAMGSAGCDGTLFFELIAEVLSPSVPDTPPTDELCEDALDNDRDGLLDCEDPDCAELAPCQPLSDVCNTSMPDNDLPHNDTLSCITWTYSTNTDLTQRITRTFDEHGRPLTFSMDNEDDGTPEQTITSQWDIEGDLKRRMTYRDAQGQETRTILWRRAPTGNHFLLQDSQGDHQDAPYVLYDNSSKTYRTSNCLDCTGEPPDRPEAQDYHATAFDAQDRVTSRTYQTVRGDLRFEEYYPDQTSKYYRRHELIDLLGLHEEFAVTLRRKDRRGRITNEKTNSHYELPWFEEMFVYKDIFPIKKLDESKDYWESTYYGTLLSVSLDEYGNPDTFLCQEYFERGWWGNSLEYIEDIENGDQSENLTFCHSDNYIFDGIGAENFTYTWLGCSLASVRLGENQIRYTYNAEGQRIRSTYWRGDEITRTLTHHPEGWIQVIDDINHLRTFDAQGRLLEEIRYNANGVLLTETHHTYDCWDAE